MPVATALLAVVSFGGFTFAAGGQEILEEIIDQRYPVDRDATFTLQNEDGSVQIYGADVTEMRLQAIKKAYSKERLGKINVNVAVQPGAVRISTDYPPKPKWGLRDRSGTVDYVIVLPWFCRLHQVALQNGEMLIDGMRGNEIHGRLGNGRLFGHNCFTSLNLEVETGGVEIAYEWWEAHPISLVSKITNGQTRVFIPSDARFRLSAETENGHIYSDFPNKEDRPITGQTNAEIEIGSGADADMKVRAVNGSINIKELYR